MGEISGRKGKEGVPFLRMAHSSLLSDGVVGTHRRLCSAPCAFAMASILGLAHCTEAGQSINPHMIREKLTPLPPPAIAMGLVAVCAIKVLPAVPD